jgi:hypothetical protein
MTCPSCGKTYPDAGPGVFACDCGARFWKPRLCWHASPDRHLSKFEQKRILMGKRPCIPPTWHRKDEPCPGTPWKET